MNIPKLLAKAAGAALLPSALLFGTADSAHAFAVFFTPPGSQLDGDPINDLEVVPGSTQAFQFNLDLPSIGSLLNPLQGAPTGTLFNGASITAFRYVLAFDATEWVPEQSSIDACNAFAGPGTCSTTPTLVPGAPALGSGVTNQFLIDLTAPAGFVIGGSPIFPIGGPISGDVGLSLPNNGDADLLGSLLSITIGGVTYASNGTASAGESLTISAQNAIFGSQSLSLQPPATEEVPGPLPLLGAGAAFGYSRRLRNRVKGGSLKSVKA